MVGKLEPFFITGARMEMDGLRGVASQEELADENKRLKAELAAMRESMSQRL